MWGQWLWVVAEPDPAVAEALVLEQHEGDSVKALGDEQVTIENRHRVLAKWMQTLDG